MGMNLYRFVDLDVEIASEDKFVGCGSNDRKEGVEFVEKSTWFCRVS